jgi:CubicO group peptidase (beta-lactamase class C family)
LVHVLILIGIPVDGDTLFNIGSITKTFTTFILS